MVDAGLLEGEPVELVDGLLVHVTPQGAEHATLVQREDLTRHLVSHVEGCVGGAWGQENYQGWRQAACGDIVEKLARVRRAAVLTSTQITMSRWHPGRVKLTP